MISSAANNASHLLHISQFQEYRNTLNNFLLLCIRDKDGGKGVWRDRMSNSEEESPRIPKRVLRSRKRHQRPINKDFHITTEKDEQNEEKEKRMDEEHKGEDKRAYEQETAEGKSDTEEESDDDDDDDDDEDFIATQPFKKRSQRQKSPSTLFTSTTSPTDVNSKRRKIKRGKNNTSFLQRTPKKAKRGEVTDRVSRSSVSSEKAKQQMKRAADLWSFIDSTTLTIE